MSIVTGRLYSGTRAIARSVGIDGPVGCVDGSHIVCVKGDRHLVSHAIGETGAQPETAHPTPDAGWLSSVQ